MYNTGHMNILLESFGSLISIVVLILLSTSEDRKSKLNRLFMRVVICNIAALLSDMAAWGFDGDTSAHGFYSVNGVIVIQQMSKSNLLFRQVNLRR